MELTEEDIILIKSRKFANEIIDIIYKEYHDNKTPDYYPIFIVGISMCIKIFSDQLNIDSASTNFHWKEIISEIQNSLSLLKKGN